MGLTASKDQEGESSRMDPKAPIENEESGKGAESAELFPPRGSALAFLTTARFLFHLRPCWVLQPHRVDDSFVI